MGPETESAGATPPPAASSGRDPPNGDAEARRPSHPAEAVRDALRRLAELREFAAYYVSVRIDALKASIRSAAMYAGLGLLGALAVGTVVVVAIVLLLVGIAGALGAALGGRAWLGDIITSLIFLVFAAIGASVGMKVMTRWFHSKMVHKYEERQRQQRQHFGQDVRDEATAAERSAGQPD